VQADQLSKFVPTVLRSVTQETKLIHLFEDERRRVSCARRDNKEDCQVQIWLKWSADQQAPVLYQCCTCAVTLELIRTYQQWLLQSCDIQGGCKNRRTHTGFGLSPAKDTNASFAKKKASESCICLTEGGETLNTPSSTSAPSLKPSLSPARTAMALKTCFASKTDRKLGVQLTFARPAAAGPRG